MKKYILIASTLVSVIAAKAQVNDIPLIGNKFTFGIDGGLSSPSGAFASTSNTSSSTSTTAPSTINGFAKGGFCYDLYAGFKFSKFIGVMGQYGASSNSFNSSDLTAGPGTTTSASGGYTTSEYLVGPYLSITLVKIKIEAKLMGGLVTNTYPTLTFNGYGSSVVDAFKSGNGFGYCAGAKIKYMMIGGMLGIGLGLDYVGSDVKYPGWSETQNISGLPSQTASNGSIKMSIGLLQATLGLSLDI